MSNTRIPTTLSLFDNYIKTITVFLQATSGSTTHGGRLGLTAPEITSVEGYLTQWYTGVPATPGAYEKHTNPATKNKATRLAVEGIMLNFGVFFTPLLTRMSGSAAITAEDRLILNIAEPNHSHRIPQSQIKDAIFALVQATGGSNISISCRTEHDASRPSLPGDADGVETAFSIGTQPLTADDAQYKKQFSKSKFTISGGLANIGKNMYIHVRWINSKHPAIAGDWSTMYIIMIV